MPRSCETTGESAQGDAVTDAFGDLANESAQGDAVTDAFGDLANANAENVDGSCGEGDDSAALTVTRRLGSRLATLCMPRLSNPRPGLGGSSSVLVAATAAGDA